MISEKIELEKMLSLIRKEIENSELSKRISEMDSKLVELRKSVEGIVIELTYIKAELKELREGGDKKRPSAIKKEEKQEKLEISESKKPVIKEEKNEEKLNRKESEDEKDLIICD
ncbi:MAG: hypothetical protein QXN34_04535 [Archaeoglobaceae archaeon]